MTQLKMLSADDALAEIRRIYFAATKQTIDRDMARALDLLKAMASEDERERAAVFMEGLAEMRSDWQKARGPGGGGRPKGGAHRSKGAMKQPAKAPAKKR